VPTVHPVVVTALHAQGRQSVRDEAGKTPSAQVRAKPTASWTALPAFSGHCLQAFRSRVGDQSPRAEPGTTRPVRWGVADVSTVAAQLPRTGRPEQEEGSAPPGGMSRSDRDA
jgi:hypothetical protein